MAFHVCALKTSLSIGEIKTNWIWMKSTTVLTVVQRNLYFVKKVINLKSFKTGDEFIVSLEKLVCTDTFTSTVSGKIYPGIFIQVNSSGKVFFIKLDFT